MPCDLADVRLRPTPGGDTRASLIVPNGLRLSDAGLSQLKMLFAIAVARPDAVFDRFASVRGGWVFAPGEVAEWAGRHLVELGREHTEPMPCQPDLATS